MLSGSQLSLLQVTPILLTRLVWKNVNFGFTLTENYYRMEKMK
jgi:hypothetical protein